MFIAHIPAGYAFARWIVNKIGKREEELRLFIMAGALGGAAPDFDIVWFLFFDERQHHHHSYWSHYPLVWAGMMMLSVLWYRYSIGGKAAGLSLMFSSAGLLHLLLDTVSGDIRWLAPFYDEPWSLVVIRALYDPWWLNFLLHWSFLLELMICFFAFLLWRKGSRDAFTAETDSTGYGHRGRSSP